VLETAITHDPYNEAIYQQIMHIQVQLGRSDAARRTLTLLETRLASLGLNPESATRQVASAPPGLPRRRRPL
jgi:DNA-binding SARP family transcriptional activator